MTVISQCLDNLKNTSKGKIMPTYKYKCNGCNRDYIEHRDVTHPQTFTHCNECNIEFTEVTE